MTMDPPAQLAAAAQESEPGLDGRPAAAPLVLTEELEGMVLVTLPTEIDISNDSEVTGMLANALAGRPAVVIADGTRTTFCDASGVSILVQAHHRAAAIGGQLRVVATTAEVRRILQVTGAGGELHLYSSVEAASQPTGT
jgi:anti-anti-sigma factor